MKPKIQIKNRHSDGRMYAVACLVAVVGFLLCGGTSSEASVALSVFVIGIVVGGGYIASRREFNAETVLFCILLLGLAMRIGYMLYTPCTVRGHDILALTKETSGHDGYILYLLGGELPPTNAGQFYHPPLYHALSALAIRFVQLFLHQTDTAQVLDGAKLISCFASCGMLFLVKCICKALKFSGKSTCITVALVAFLPNFYLLAGRMNNDALAVFFMLAVLLYTIRWYHDQCTKNTVLLALCFGLGMMTKISVAVLAVPTGAVMLYSAVRALKKKEGRAVLKQLLLFVVICLPLALWYPLRNYLLFHQPLGYVLQPKMAAELFVGNHSPAERFFSFPRLFSQIYCLPYDDYNIPVYLLKGALFGEFTLPVAQPATQLLLIVYCALSVLLAWGVITAIFQWKKIAASWHFLILAGAVLLLSYLWFNIQYPYGCTMDFRYIVPLYVIAALCAGKKTTPRVYNWMLTAVLLVFSVLSMYVYCAL